MKKIFVLIMMLFLICPIYSFSQEKPHKSAKRTKIETISKKRAKRKTAPKKKRAQEKREKARIKNNKPEKMNHLRKK